MTNYNTAVKDLLWIARRTQGIVELIPALEQIATLENTTSEAKATLESLKESIEALSAEKVSLVQENDKARKEAEAALYRASERIRKHEEESLEAIKAAQKEIIEAASAEVEMVRQDRKSVLESIENHKKILSDVQSKVAEAEAKLRLINEQISSLKAKF